MLGGGISVGAAVGGESVSVGLASGKGVAVLGGGVWDGIAVGEEDGAKGWHPLRRSRAANPHKRYFFGFIIFFLRFQKSFGKNTVKKRGLTLVKFYSGNSISVGPA
jgi:hypothetical protein